MPRLTAMVALELLLALVLAAITGAAAASVATTTAAAAAASPSILELGALGLAVTGLAT